MWWQGSNWCQDNIIIICQNWYRWWLGKVHYLKQRWRSNIWHHQTTMSTGIHMVCLPIFLWVTSHARGNHIHDYSGTSGVTPKNEDKADDTIKNFNLNLKLTHQTITKSSVDILWDILRVHSGYGLCQWEKALHCNAFSHWLSPYPKWSLHTVNAIDYPYTGIYTGIPDMASCKLRHMISKGHCLAFWQHGYHT